MEHILFIFVLLVIFYMIKKCCIFIKNILREVLLFRKYHDWMIVKAIMSQKVWMGMTREQLLDSRGQPADIDSKVYKSKTAETFKYNQIGKNRFRNRVTIENDSVVGWEEK